MMKIQAIPLESVGKIKFGMKKSEVMSLLGKAAEFKKATASSVLTDDFGYCHVFYNSSDECEAVEIFDGVEVYIGDNLFFPTSLDNTVNFIDDFKRDEDGLTSIKAAIGIYAPDNKMESILFGARGYFD